jgi:3-deoxy-D-manno-octulosonic-acid transferase
MILDALARRPLPPETLVVIVPRHPQRFDDVAALLRTRGLAHVGRSENRAVPFETGFVLGDSMGEMSGYYGASDVAFVGGSLVPVGGQNLIEATAMGVPVIVGPHTFNFAEAAARAVEAEAAIRVADADDLVAKAAMLLADPARRAAMRVHAQGFLAAHRERDQRTWRYVEGTAQPASRRLSISRPCSLSVPTADLRRSVLIR